MTHSSGVSPSTSSTCDLPLILSLYDMGISYKVPSRVIHDAKTGPQGAKVIATYVVEKGQPLATAPQ